MSLIVTHRSAEVLRVEKSRVGCLDELFDSLQRALDLAPESLKMLHRGRLLTGSSLSALLLEEGDASVVLLGSTQSELRSLRQLEAKAESLQEKEAMRAAAPRVYVRDAVKSADRKYGFGKLVTLPGLPEEERSRRILEELANDPGVLRVMEKFQWRVGELCEMYPEGQVGISEVCVLGLNENRGQRIRLRLRTDDLQGFRKLLNIRNVLFHELAHNVWGDHDDNFYMLMREIEREANALDWRRSSGYTTGDGRRVRPTDREVLGLDRATGTAAPEENMMKIRDLSGAGRGAASNFQGGSHVLGRSSDAQDALEASERAGITSDPRALAALAATERFREGRRGTQQTRTVQGPNTSAEPQKSRPGDFCGECSNPGCPCVAEEKTASEGANKSMMKREDTLHGDQVHDTAQDVSEMDAGDRMDIVEASEVPKEEHASIGGEGETKATSNRTEEDQLLLEASLQGMGPAGSRLQQVIAEFANTRSATESQRQQTAAQLMLKVFGNILANLSEEKFQSIKEANRAYQSKIANVENAEEVLKAAGFDWEGDGLDRKLTWKRKDVALLWAGKALLEATLA